MEDVSAGISICNPPRGVRGDGDRLLFPFSFAGLRNETLLLLVLLKLSVLAPIVFPSPPLLRTPRNDEDAEVNNPLVVGPMRFSLLSPPKPGIGTSRCNGLVGPEPIGDANMLVNSCSLAERYS